MRTVNIYKAGKTVTEIKSQQIIIQHEIPEAKSLEDARSMYSKESLQLFNALRDSLPGGTFDALLQRMLTFRASLFRVPLFEKKDKKEEVMPNDSH